MQSLQMHKHLKRAMDRILKVSQCVLSSIVFLCIVYINHTVYASIISRLLLFLLYFLTLMVGWIVFNMIQKRTNRCVMRNVGLIVTACVCIAAESVSFYLLCPTYTYQEAVRLVCDSGIYGEVNVESQMRTIVTTEPLGRMLHRGYVVEAVDAEGRICQIFVHPLTGETGVMNKT